MTIKKITQKIRVKNIRKTRKNYRKKHHYRLKSKSGVNVKLKGGNTKKTLCCICNKKVDIDKTLIPRICLKEHGAKAHRICQSCWWDPKTGFAIEESSHKCPGCVKNMPLTEIDYGEVIEL